MQSVHPSTAPVDRPRAHARLRPAAPRRPTTRGGAPWREVWRGALGVPFAFTVGLVIVLDEALPPAVYLGVLLFLQASLSALLTASWWLSGRRARSP